MEVSSTTLWVLAIIFICVVLWIRGKRKLYDSEEKKANEVYTELHDNKNIEEAGDVEIEDALKSGNVYMMESKREKFGWYPHSYMYGHAPVFRGSTYPYGGYPYSDLYDWRPVSYYGGAWFKPFYPPNMYLKRKSWSKGRWRKNKENFYYITHT